MKILWWAQCNVFFGLDQNTEDHAHDCCVIVNFQGGVWFSTWWPSVPGCWSSFTVLPPAVFWPRPSCQVRFPPVRRLSWCLKSSGSALYSTAGRQKLKLEAAGHTHVGTYWEIRLSCTISTHSAAAHSATHLITSFRGLRILHYPLFVLKSHVSADCLSPACHWCVKLSGALVISEWSHYWVFSKNSSDTRAAMR